VALLNIDGLLQGLFGGDVDEERQVRISMDKAAIESEARVAISPLKPAGVDTIAEKDFLFSAKRTDAGRSLPPYYLVYFLLVNLLGFRNIGQFEKVAWSIPVDYEGRAFLIEHRKFGLGIFAATLPSDEVIAQEIVKRIHDAVKISEPYFDWMANEAASGSNLNVVNKARHLHARHRFYIDQYSAKWKEAEARKDERVRTEYKNGFGIEYPAYALRQEAKWLALSAIESFFSWTEHIFIHLGILKGSLTTGLDVKRIANENWFKKFEMALDVSDPVTKRFLDELTIIRQQLRNFDAHGSFGKNREAFSFHSDVGAVPLRLPHNRDPSEMKFGQGIDFVERDAILVIEAFSEHLWSGPRAAAKIYIQESDLPLILSQAKDGTYAAAMTSEVAMKDFTHHQLELHDRYANMDF
jgi:hypothetical protein